MSNVYYKADCGDWFEIYYFDDDKLINMNDDLFYVECGPVKIYMKKMGEMFVFHRDGGLPACVDEDAKDMMFMYDGMVKRIEDLDVDDLEKTMLLLKHPLRTRLGSFHIYTIFNGVESRIRCHDRII